MVICLGQGANDLHMVQATAILSSLACFIKMQIGVTFLVPAYPEKRPLNECLSTIDDREIQRRYCH